MFSNLESEQPFHIQFKQLPGYLLAIVTGETDSLEVSRQYWAEIAAEVLKQKPKNLLVWEDFGNMVSSVEMMTLVQELCEYPQFRNLRIAFVDEHLAQFERNKLGEMIATNRGMVGRVFSHLEDAENWLANT